MQGGQSPHGTTISPLTDFGPDCADEVLCARHVARQHEHAVYDEDAGGIYDMWKNWLNIPNEAQSLDMDTLLGVPLSTCISPLPKISSQSSTYLLPSSNTTGPEPIETCFISHKSLPLTSTTLPNYVSDVHNLHTLYGNDHVNEPTQQQLDTGADTDTSTTTGRKSASPYSPLSEMNVMAPLSPPPVDVKTTKSSSHKKKQAEVAKNFKNSRVRKNEAETYCLLAKTAEDDYIWHKYGQKSIKNRTHPRGYFKCAHPKCPVKKQTEIDPDRQGLLLITYIGKHNHQKP